MKIIDKNTVVVFSSTELKSVLEGTNTYNYIYFGSNIKLSSGITIAQNKTNVVIDGTYENTMYTYEDMNSTGTGDTISVRNKNNQTVTVQNMNVIGHNYYGIIYVPEDNNLQNIIVTYQNLTYTGPQITFHPTGLSRYINCQITIITSFATANEVAECNQIEIGGTTVINHQSTIDSMFWYRGSKVPSFTILKQAIVTLTSDSRELFYGVNNLSLTLQEGSRMTLKTAHGMGYNGYSTGTVLIDKFANLSITQTKQNGSYATWYCNGPFTMNENSSLSIVNSYASSTSNYNLYFRSTSATFILNQPKEMVLYNKNADVIYTNSQIPFQFTFSRINFWKTAADIKVAGTLQNLPDDSFYKANDLSIVTGTMNTSTTTIQTTNYTEEELQSLPSIKNFSFQNRKQLSIGTIPLHIDYIDDKTYQIGGMTTPTAQIQLNYLKETTIVTADSTGTFQKTLDTPLPIGTQIQFLANIPNSFLYTNREVTIVYPGELTIDSAPSTITFHMVPFQTNPVLCAKVEPISIVVSDTRLNSKDWNLCASITQELTSDNGYVLKDAIVYVDDSKNYTPLTQTPIPIYTGTSNQGTPKMTTITFDKLDTIVLRILNQFVENGETYRTTIIWSLEETKKS